MNELSSINSGIISFRPSAFLEVILYDDKMLNDYSNQQILTSAINYIKNARRFEQSLFQIFEGNPFYQLATNFLAYFKLIALLFMKKW